MTVRALRLTIRAPSHDVTHGGGPIADRTASTNRDVPVARSYVFLAELLQEEDGRWSAGVPSLPGCATWGHTEAEALRNLQDAVEAYVRDVRKAGGEIPKDAAAEVRDEPLVAVTI